MFRIILSRTGVLVASLMVTLTLAATGILLPASPAAAQGATAGVAKVVDCSAPASSEEIAACGSVISYETSSSPRMRWVTDPTYSCEGGVVTSLFEVNAVGRSNWQYIIMDGDETVSVTNTVDPGDPIAVLSINPGQALPNSTYTIIGVEVKDGEQGQRSEQRTFPVNCSAAPTTPPTTVADDTNNPTTTIADGSTPSSATDGTATTAAPAAATTSTTGLDDPDAIIEAREFNGRLLALEEEPMDAEQFLASYQACLDSVSCSRAVATQLTLDDITTIMADADDEQKAALVEALGLDDLGGTGTGDGQWGVGSTMLAIVVAFLVIAVVFLAIGFLSRADTVSGNKSELDNKAAQGDLEQLSLRLEELKTVLRNRGVIPEPGILGGGD